MYLTSVQIRLAPQEMIIMAEALEKRKQEKDKNIIEVKKQVLVDLFNYFGAHLTHPHGEEVYAKKPKVDDDNKPILDRLGRPAEERLHTHHVHRPNQLFALEHEWYHRIGAITGKLEYEVVQK